MKKYIKLIVFLFIVLFLLNLLTISYATDTPKITAEAAMLMDSSTGKIVYEKNIDEKIYPASTTKILTALLTIENCNLDDVATVPYDALKIVPSGYSVAALQAGENVTIDQLLRMLMVYSANDAANVLAFHISGSIDSFANLMNSKLVEMGIINTHFTNPSGKHDENHYTTAHDMGLLMQQCMKNSTFRQYAGLKSCTIPATNKYEERFFKSTNEMLVIDTRNISSNYYYPYLIAGKTGYTTEAKNCFIGVSNKDGIELISVILGVGVYPGNLSAKFIETKALFEYGYENYTIRKIREKEAIVTQIDIPNGSKDTKNLDVILSNDITALVKQTDLETDYTPDIIINENLTAPIRERQVIGKINYQIDGIDYSTDLLASHEVKPTNRIIVVFQIVLIFFILYLLYRLLFTSFKKKNKRKKNKNVGYFYKR